MKDTSLSIQSAINFGWMTFKKHWSFFLLLILTTVGIMLLAQLIFVRGGEGLVFVIYIVQTIVLSIMSIGLIQIILKIIDNDKKPEFLNLFTEWKFLLNFLLASILKGVIIFAGLILFIIPGIILSIRLSMTKVLVVDKNMGPIKAIKESFRMTENFGWDLLAFYMVAGIIQLLGLLALFVGLAVATPLTLVAYLHIYRQLGKLKSNA